MTGFPWRRFNLPLRLGGLPGCNSTDIGFLLVANTVCSHTISVSKVGLSLKLSVQVVLPDVMFLEKDSSFSPGADILGRCVIRYLQHVLPAVQSGKHNIEPVVQLWMIPLSVNAATVPDDDSD